MALPLGLALIIGEHEEALPAWRTQGVRGWLVWLSSPRGGRAMLLFLAVMLMTLSLLMTRSRSGLGGFAAIALMMILVVARRFQSRALVAWLSVGFGLFGGLMLIWASQFETVRGVMHASSISMRVAIWRDAWSIIQRFPIFGAGLNTFGKATILYQSSGAEHYNEAHNDYLQLLAEGGLILGVIVFGIVALLIRSVRRQFRAHPDLTSVYWIRVGAVVGLIAVALQSAVEFSLQMPGNAALFTVLLAVALYAPHRRRSVAAPTVDD